MSNGYVPYISKESYGVAAIDFYKKFDTCLASASRATGVSCKSASRVPIKRASKENTQKIVYYLEEVSIKYYLDAIKTCEQDIEQALGRVEEAWKSYQDKERMLDEFRIKYEIPRVLMEAEKREVRIRNDEKKDV